MPFAYVTDNISRRNQIEGNVMPPSVCSEKIANPTIAAANFQDMRRLRDWLQEIRDFSATGMAAQKWHSRFELR
jgi:hypothetical protein